MSRCQNYLHIDGKRFKQFSINISYYKEKKFMNLVFYTYFNFSNIIIYILQNRKSIKISFIYFESIKKIEFNLDNI